MNTEVIRILSDVFEVKEDKITLDLVKDDIDNWDSLRQMDLVVSLEEAFEIELEVEEIVALTSVKNIIEILTKKGAI